jgi:DinB superfamily
MISNRLGEITQLVKQEFSGFSDSELNVRPAEDKWSIAQCLDHLIVSNETYIPAFESLINGIHRTTFWQRMNPLTGFAGKKGREILQSGKIKLKAPALFTPSKSADIKNIVERFTAHQLKMGSIFDQLEQKGLRDITISSPVTSVLTLKSGDAIEIIIEHEARHLRQAINVKQECIKKEQ